MSDVIEIGEGLTDPTSFNYSSLFSDLAPSDLQTLQALSVNCDLQQALGFGELLVKHDWGEEDKSYCQWHGKSGPLALKSLVPQQAHDKACTYATLVRIVHCGWYVE